MSNLDNRSWESCDVQLGHQSVGNLWCPTWTSDRWKVIPKREMPKKEISTLCSKNDIETIKHKSVKIIINPFITKTSEWSLGNVGLASAYVLCPSRLIQVPTILHWGLWITRSGILEWRIPEWTDTEVWSAGLTSPESCRRTRWCDTLIDIWLGNIHDELHSYILLRPQGRN